MREEDLLNPRVRHAWVAPLLSTLLTLPAAGFALLYGGLSPMACDSCDGAEADRFTESFDAAWSVLCTGLLLSMAVLLTSWVLPWRLRQAPRRLVLATAAPAVVAVAFVAFTALVDRP
ncbi:MULTISPECIES: hypothetical protein [unclassified Streptomyces]|uniref:hypothetical protein n=1 Tax=Streptomyces TaxID=1883 RepID=UPI0001C1A83C|nr:MULTISPECIES: hypothetical protein [unclassified Streptomyces]AEN10651.1 conserved hypothetical protein [Streptomyces sp. SirexAA-E]MYR65606.1 hypothetical protein [Streptomyces sp. SID4939]MYS00249.1 hypothetical protein [Streptomyces sp. SID4940]MYT62161.1 hypothetical protein [Streptomyces sp. SID8357]MYT84043.1 hypothetical protein [Streptomyces sp. SID8360]